MRNTKTKKPEMTYFSIRIKTDTEKKVCAYAEKHKWTRNFAIGEILEQFLSIKE